MAAPGRPKARGSTSTDRYYRRRLNDRDIVEAKPPAPVKEPVAPQASAEAGAEALTETEAAKRKTR